MHLERQWKVRGSKILVHSSDLQGFLRTFRILRRTRIKSAPRVFEKEIFPRQKLLLQLYNFRAVSISKLP